jgi:hypothetical protein
MKKRGSVIYNGLVYNYEIDESRYICILEGGIKTNIGQIRPLQPSDDIEEVVLEMLRCGGY